MDEAELRAWLERDRLEARRWPTEALVGRLAVVLRRHQHEQARLLGLREVELACLQLVDRPRAISMTALAERLGLSRAATTAVVDRLVALGRAVRWQDEEDRRRTVVAAVAPPGETAPWRRLTEQLAARQDGFTDDELRVVARWIVAMGDELHVRAAGLTDARDRLARRDRPTTARTNLYSSVDSDHGLS
ncbi:DNA-binding MarR family transcriptional regulator [Actinomycetospora succinea]|uniref:DNA-binding MarR family transcriptional regulator n=1 Tax=Actinomycetospora succinea TaxID=663603 RepID=A0A4R6UIB1_9PSEU|nr:MarR family transcriptional regulator [Actinomycetospora succinea]TDQ46182.1 DNA-binding MarR family transcriptional regulator [Actinomycetospora succinea]